MTIGRPPSTHCKRGHAFTEDNVYRSPTNPAHRMCATCRRERSRKRHRPPADNLELRATIASLRAELDSARQQLRAQRRVIADLQRDVSLLRSRQRQPAAITHRRIVDGGIGGRAERRELRRAA